MSDVPPRCQSLPPVTQVVGAKGEVVIPLRFRCQLDLNPGDEVDFVLLKNGVAVMPVAKRGSLKGSFAGRELVAALVEDRAREPR